MSEEINTINKYLDDINDMEQTLLEFPKDKQTEKIKSLLKYYRSILMYKYSKLLDLEYEIGEFTLQDIGSIYDVSRERVRQIEEKCIKNIRHPKLCRNLLKYIRS